MRNSRGNKLLKRALTRMGHKWSIAAVAIAICVVSGLIYYGRNASLPFGVRLTGAAIQGLLDGLLVACVIGPVLHRIAGTTQESELE